MIDYFRNILVLTLVLYYDNANKCKYDDDEFDYYFDFDYFSTTARRTKSRLVVLPVVLLELGACTSTSITIVLAMHPQW
jgi:hypothetical protein